MATLTQVLREEISKAVKRETNAAIKVLQQENRELKTALVRLEKSVTGSSVPMSVETPASPVAFTSDSLRQFRHNLGLSQREIAILCGVSSQAVYLWECKGGKLRLRNETRRKLLGLQKMSKRSVKKQLSKAYE
ncbi:MAG: helix-turn-helix transcriptional regulator [Kiritimatiellae bacterium]|nr:helix-turn-helix transcriptional regulator [Kiritimatiellia bacterium]